MYTAAVLDNCNTLVIHNSVLPLNRMQAYPRIEGFPGLLEETAVSYRAVVCDPNTAQPCRPSRLNIVQVSCSQSRRVDGERIFEATSRERTGIGGAEPV